jgi:hypothetical protein
MFFLDCTNEKPHIKQMLNNLFGQLARLSEITSKCKTLKAYHEGQLLADPFSICQ